MDPIKVPDLASPQFKANPYPFYARLRREAPVLRTTLPFWKTAWLVLRYDDVLAVLKDPRFGKDLSPAISRIPWLPRFVRRTTRSMLILDPPDHTRLRNLVLKAFTPRLIERLRARIQSLCEELLDRAAANAPFELVRGYALLVPLTIIAELLGIPEQERHRLHAWLRRPIAAITSLDLLRSLPNIWLIIRQLERLFAQRRDDPRDDLVTALVQVEEAGDKLSEDELLAMVYLLLIAGYDTTVYLISSGTLALLQHPEQREHFQQDPSVTGSAIEELLRFTSPLEIASHRFAREDLTIGSATIPRGALVLAVLGSANRDESQFVNPNTLDIARQPNNHLAFGQGAHFCLGAALARLEGQIALTTLFRRFPNLSLTQPPEPLRWRKSLFFRGLEELPVLLR